MVAMSFDPIARQLAARQHALVAVHQLRDLGATESQVKWLRRSGGWEPVGRRALRLVGSPPTPGQGAMAAVFDASPAAILSHTSAAAWWGLPGFDLEPFHVTRARGITRRASPVTRIHEVVTLLPHHVKVFTGVPVSSPARVICEIAGMGLHPLKVARACDTAWAMALFNGATMHRTFHELAASGRNGIVMMREILADRPVDYMPPASGLERRFQAILADAGLKPMRRQVDVGGDDWVGRVDFLDADLPMLAEINSDRFHAALTDENADARRYAALDRAGFEVCVLWENVIWQDPRRVIADVRAARRRARTRRAT